MLTVDPEERLSVDEAVSHPWISEREGCAPKAHLHDTVDELRKFNSRRYITVLLQRTWNWKLKHCSFFLRYPSETGRDLQKTASMKR